MPSGRYEIADASGRAIGHEEFRSAPGPAGWRSFSTIEIATPRPSRTTVDVAVDASWRVVRLRLETADRSVTLSRRDDALVGEIAGTALSLPADAHLDGPSVWFNVVATHRLGGTADAQVVYLDPDRDEPALERQRYEALAEEEVETSVGRFAARRWRYSVAETGGSAELWIAGAAVVAFPPMFTLVAYEPGASGPAPIG